MPRSTWRSAAAALALLLSAAAAPAQAALRWLRTDTGIEAGASTAAPYERVARDFEARRRGVKVVVQVLENEDFKALVARHPGPWCWPSSA